MGVSGGGRPDDDSWAVKAVATAVSTYTNDRCYMFISYSFKIKQHLVARAEPSLTPSSTTLRGCQTPKRPSTSAQTKSLHYNTT